MSSIWMTPGQGVASDSAPDPDPSAWPVLWRRCWSRIRTWGAPPRWAPSDWGDEARAQGALAASLAWREFDPGRGVPLDAFLYRRVVEAVWARHRQERSFGRRSRSGEAVPEQPAPEHDLPDPEQLDCVAALLDRLDEAERRLIRQLFWDGRGEGDLAREWGVSQQSVNKRKQRILGELRRRLGAP